MGTLSIDLSCTTINEEQFFQRSNLSDIVVEQRHVALPLTESWTRAFALLWLR
jgi:hypothetical protein